MNIKARLAKLEARAPGNRGRCVVLPLYDGETRDDALAAHPDIEPGKADMLVFVKQYRAAGPERQDVRVWPMVA